MVRSIEYKTVSCFGCETESKEKQTIYIGNGISFVISSDSDQFNSTDESI